MIRSTIIISVSYTHLDVYKRQTHPDLTYYLKEQGEVYYDYAEGRDRRISSFINSAYSFKGKYIVNAGFRYDGSNQLGSSREARYLPSWNVSAAWNMHDEAFMKGISEVVNTLKPKISYGYNGIMGPSTSAELAIYAKQTCLLYTSRCV